MRASAEVAPPDHADEPNRWRFAEGDAITPGRYALKLLGGGTRYEAYLAHDDTLLSMVVVKILRPDRVDDERTLQPLIDEYAAVRALDHPSIVRAFDAILNGRRPHIVLEFLDGPRLSTLIRKYGRLPLEQSIPLAVQLSSALHYMHSKRMVHLDVKPSNVIMGAPPRLIDLSIARSFEDATNLRVPVGTDAYMAPEQCELDPSTPVGPAADVWGLGVTLYQAVTGRLPFPKMSPGERHPQLDMDPVPLDDDIPSGVVELIDRSLRRDPDERPTARQLAQSLEPLVAALPRRPVLSRLRPRL
ncbi:MAG: serine/threonine-protein kinase [Actinomycetota bacterium]